MVTCRHHIKYAASKKAVPTGAAKAHYKTTRITPTIFRSLTSPNSLELSDVFRLSPITKYSSDLVCDVAYEGWLYLSEAVN